MHDGMVVNYWRKDDIRRWLYGGTENQRKDASRLGRKGRTTDHCHEC